MKKLISIFLVIAMTLLSVNIVIAEEDYKAKLTSIGIYQEDLFTNGNITRGDFARLVMNFTNRRNTGECEYTRFIDVSVGHKAAYAINYLYDMGYISGYGDFTYRPDVNITYTEAMYVMIACLGYNYSVENGIYWGTGLNVAEQLELFEGIEPAAMNNPITEADAIRLLYNALKVEIIEKVVEGDTVKLELSGETPLEKYWDMFVVKGIVTATHNTGLYNISDATGDGYIKIGNQIFVTDADYTDLLGYEVQCHYLEEDGEYKIIFIEKTSKNTVVEFDGADIEEYEGERIRYTAEDDKTAYVKYNDETAVIFNGVAYTGYGRIENIDAKHSELKFIDNDGDGIAEIIEFTEYRDFYVSRLDTDSLEIFDEQNSVSIDLGADEEDINIYSAEGTKISFEEIPIDGVVSVKMSKSTVADEPIVSVYVIDKKITGMVEEIKPDEYVIDGKGYKLSQNYNLNAQPLNLNTKAEFYLTKRGEIIARQLNSGSGLIGVVRKIFETTSDDQIWIKIYSQDGEFKQYELSERVKIDDKTITATKTAVEEKVAIGTPIMYTLNDEGLLRTIDTPLPYTEENVKKKGEFRQINSSAKFEILGSVITGEAIAASGRTIIMGIPTDLTNDEAYGLVSYSDYSKQFDNKTFMMYSYGSDEIATADLLIGYDASVSVINAQSASIYLVRSRYAGLNDYDEPADILEVVDPQTGSDVQLYLADTLDTTDFITYSPAPVATRIRGVEASVLSKGDVIRIAKNAVGEVVRIELLYDYDKPNNPDARLRVDDGYVDTCDVYSDAKYLAMQRLIYSKLEGASGEFFQYYTSFFSTTSDWINHTNLIYRKEISRVNSDSNMIAYNVATDTVKKVTRADLPQYKGKKFILSLNQNLLQRLIIFE